jgi:pimeloyl-ACP methyl ester carboxylesterase
MLRACALILAVVWGACSVAPAAAQPDPDESWAKSVGKALAKVGWKVGADRGKEYVQLRYDSGWQPLSGPLTSRLELAVTLYRATKQAAPAFAKIRERQSPAVRMPAGEGRQAFIGTDVKKLYYKDEASGLYRPQAFAEGALQCGDLLAEAKVAVRGPQAPREAVPLLPAAAGASEEAGKKKDKEPTFAELKDLVQQAIAATRTVMDKAANVFAKAELCDRDADRTTPGTGEPGEGDALKELLQAQGYAVESVAEGSKDLYWISQRGIIGLDYVTMDPVVEVIAERSDTPENYARMAEDTLEGFRDDPLFVVLEPGPGRVSTMFRGLDWPSAIGGDGSYYPNAVASGAVLCSNYRVQIRLTLLGPSLGREYPEPAAEAAAAEPLAARLTQEIDARMRGLLAAMDAAEVPCAGDSFELADARPDIDIELLDANPLFTPEGRAVAGLSPRELAGLDTVRGGVAADGASRVVVRVALRGQAEVTFTLAQGDSDLSPSGRLWPIDADLDAEDATPPEAVKTATQEVDGRHYAFALYEAPAEFGPAFKTELLGVGMRPVTLSIAVSRDGAAANVQESAILVARPPVVLVHGTYSTPAKWTESSLLLGGSSMVEALERNAFRTWLVDFSKSNGSPDSGPSHFQDLRRVVWDDSAVSADGAGHGIAAALAGFRDELGLAATRAVVVGHSLGGLLARVYASPAYMLDGDDAYRRPKNFGRGDIHRLITLCTPHHGSDLPRILTRLREVSFARLNLLTWAKDKGLVTVAEWVAGLDRGASADQIPESDALRRIGATEVPAHAIICSARIDDFLKPILPRKDLRNVYYRLLFGQLAELFARSPHAIPKVFPAAEAAPPPPVPPGAAGESCPVVAVAARPKPDAERLADFVAEMDWDHWHDKGELRRRCGSLADCALQRATDPPTAVTERFFHQLFRAALFGNTPNDGTVRFESQVGGLEERHITKVDHIQHGEAPLYAEVQLAVVELLTQPRPYFAGGGFPDAGRPLADLPPGMHVQPAEERLLAISRSNLVPAHAEAIARVAAARDVIIMIRPVNGHSTPLIAAGAATKSMHVKGKSSDWGPQRGLIAVDQAYSKLSGADAGKIGKFNCEIVSSLKKGDPARPETLIARRKTLTITAGGRSFQVRKMVDSGTGGQPVLVLRDETGAYSAWQAPGAPPPVAASDGNTLPLEVLTAPDRDAWLTADYDLLGVGTRFADPPPAEMDPERGFISACQKAMVVQVNAEVAAQSGYTGGNVVHHGPENQFTMSPGNDYPVVVFEPGPRGGWIRIIEAGPQGYADRELKAYWGRMELEGWYLKPNPRWNWGALDPETGYDPGDKSVGDKQSDDNDGEEPPKEAHHCPPLPPCGTKATQPPAAWMLDEGVDPAALGCWAGSG